MALVVSVPIPLRAQLARAPTRHKPFLKNYRKTKSMQRTLDLDVTHITFYDKRRNINRKRRVFDL